MERKLMFPANIFLESEEEELLKQEIKKYCSFTGRKIQMKSISIEEEKFLKKLCGEMHHLKMSRGLVIKGTVYVTEGPLKGLENQICKIDRHKRLAKVKPELEGCRDHFCCSLAGLEIMEKVV